MASDLELAVGPPDGEHVLCLLDSRWPRAPITKCSHLHVTADPTLFSTDPATNRQRLRSRGAVLLWL